MSENNPNTFGEQRNESQTVDRRTYLKLAGAAGSGIGAGIGTGALGANFTASVRAASVIEDFDYSSSSEMKDHYDFYFGQSNASLGSVSSTATSDASDSVLEITGGNTKMVAYDDGDGSDLTAYPQVGDTITCWIRGANATENVNVNYGAEDGDGRDDHYYVKVNMEKPVVGIGVVDDGDATWLQSAPEDPSFSANAWYRLEIQWNDGSPNTHDVTLYDQNGNSMASLSYNGTDSADPQHEGHGFGYSAYLGSSSEAAQFDYAKTDSSSESTGYNYYRIDDFEGSDLEEYRFDKGENGARITHRDAYDGPNRFKSTYAGQYSLEIHNDYTEMISLPGDGLENYPSAGDTISAYFMPTGGADNLNFSWGVQSQIDKYYTKIEPSSGKMHLFKYKDDEGTYLDGESVSLSQDTWYWIEVNWGTDGTHTVELYDIKGDVLATVTGTDSEWTNGGIGFDAYLPNEGEKVYFDQVRIGEYEEKKGGWGPIVQPSFDRDTDSAYWQLVEDFKFVLSTNYDPDNPDYYTFTIGAIAQTYDIREDVSFEEATETQLAPRLGLDSLSQTVNITGEDGSDVSDDVDLSVNSGKIGYNFFTGGEWSDWKDATLDVESTQEELREAGVENDEIFTRNGDGDVDFQQVVQIGGGIIAIGFGGPVAKTAGALGTPLALKDVYQDLTAELDCGYDRQSETDYDYRKWDPCDESSPLMMSLATYTLKVPLDTQININIEQNVGLTDTVPENTSTTMEWRPTIQTDGTLDLSEDDYGLK